MNVAKHTFLVGIVLFLFVGAFGVSQTEMATKPGGSMTGCPLMGVPALCHMSPLTHAFTLQDMLIMIPFSGIFMFFITLLLALSVISLVPLFLNTPSLSAKLFKRPPARRSGFPPRFALQEAFSNGILHSKAY